MVIRFSLATVNAVINAVDFFHKGLIDFLVNSIENLGREGFLTDRLNNLFTIVLKTTFKNTI